MRSGVNTGDCAVIKKIYNDVILGSDNLVCKCKDNIIPNFLQIYLTSSIGRKYLDKYITGATNSHITPENTKKIKTPLPPLDIQQQIVSLMDSAYTRKRELEHQADELLNSIEPYILNELEIQIPEVIEKKIFTVKANEVKGRRLDPLFYAKGKLPFKSNIYKFEKLEKLGSYFKAGFAAGKEQQSKDNNGVIQIRPTNISEDRLLIFEKNIFINISNRSKYLDDLLQKEEVLFNNTNSQELVGKTVYFDLEGDYFCSNHITRISTKKENLLPRFLWLILNIYQRYKYFFNICTNWNNQSGVNIELLKTIQIPLPPLSIQENITNEAQRRFNQVEQMNRQAKEVVEQAKKEVDKILFNK